MPEIGFYHLTRTSLEQALPRLLEKVLASGLRAVVRVPGDERLRALDRHLWSYETASFLPHGSRADGFAEHQPIWLTRELDRPNAAAVLVLVDGAPLESLDGYARVLDLFDGDEPTQVEEARQRWRSCRERGFDLVYWRQTERGGWQAEREHRPRPGEPAGAAASEGEAPSL